jgi:hypothetical protein
VVVFCDYASHGGPNTGAEPEDGEGDSGIFSPVANRHAVANDELCQRGDACAAYTLYQAAGDEHSGRRHSSADAATEKDYDGGCHGRPSPPENPGQLALESEEGGQTEEVPVEDPDVVVARLEVRGNHRQG